MKSTVEHPNQNKIALDILRANFHNLWYGIPKFDPVPKELLEKLYTKQLLRFRTHYLHLEGWRVENWKADPFWVKAMKNIKQFNIDIREVLATREHIPTKAQKKKARQEAAKRKR